MSFPYGPGQGTPRRIRYYHTARTAHLERQSNHAEAWLLYTATRGDFDMELARRLPYVRRVSLLGLLRFLMTNNVDVVEVPEPFAIRLWPQLLVVHTWCLISGLGGRAKVEVVSYAIENYSPSAKLEEFSGIPSKLCGWIVQIVGRYLLRTSSRIAFGTQGALDTYEAEIGLPNKRWNAAVELFLAIPSKKGNRKSSRRELSVCFIGTFEHRKGISKLVEAWPYVLEIEPRATLEIMGNGPLVDVVVSAASRFDSVTFTPSPEREYIFASLAQTRTLVLLSQPARGWREQVGLPIVEGLENGCLIVSTGETGIANWLEQNGHFVVDWDASASLVAAAIVSSFRSPKTESSVWSDLPTRDGREAADCWLFAKPDVSV